MLYKERVFTHESGHALMCYLLQVRCCGVAYDNTKPGFCTLREAEHNPLTKNDCLVLAAGAAAEKVVPPINENESDWREGVESDKARFPDEKSFLDAVETATGILSHHKATIELLRSILLKKVREYQDRVECLPECKINGHHYAILLSAQELTSVSGRAK